MYIKTHIKMFALTIPRPFREVTPIIKYYGKSGGVTTLVTDHSLT